MLEQETERLLDVLQRRTIGRADAILIRDLLAAEIPKPLKAFFRAEVESTLDEELRRARASSRFNYAHPEVQSLQRQMNSVLVFNYSLSREEFFQKLSDGVHLVLNYLLRPHWTLSSFLYNLGNTLDHETIRRMISYFTGHDYIKEVLRRYLDAHQPSALPRDEFELLIWRIDTEYVRRRSPHELAELASPLCELVHFPRWNGSQPLPARAFVRFFEDKRLRMVCEEIEHRIANEGTELLTISQLTTILEDLLRRDPDAFVADATFVRKQISFGAAGKPQVAPLAPVAPAPASPPQSPPGKELRRASLADLISEDDRKRFLKRIFHRDETRFARAVVAMNNMSSFKEASIFLDEILIANDVDPYSAEARRLAEIVHQYFFPSAPPR